jgi:hypothetical protein
MEMLDCIASAVKEETIYLFMDGAQYHKNHKEQMEKLNIVPIFNVAYRFEYNPVERLWGQYK